MKLDDYQKKSAVTVKYTIQGDLIYFVLGLLGEAGEVAEKIKKNRRDGGLYAFPKEPIAQELGDVLWYVAQLADVLGYSLEDIAKMNLKKLKSRKDRDKIDGSGDNR